LRKNCLKFSLSQKIVTVLLSYAGVPLDPPLLTYVNTRVTFYLNLTRDKILISK